MFKKLRDPLKNYVSSRNAQTLSENSELATKPYQMTIRRGAMSRSQPKFVHCSSKIVFQRALNTPAKIQDFLNAISAHSKRSGETCFSPKTVLKKRRANCIEGAMFAAAALRTNGFHPLLVDLKANDYDFDHVIAVFQSRGFWGAISKTNHAVLRYREPIYRDIRELVMSYFHEYFLDDGVKTLRSYTLPFDLSRFDKRGWVMSEKDVWYIPNALDKARHFPILSRSQLMRLRKADPIERRVGKLLEWKV